MINLIKTEFYKLRKSGILLGVIFLSVFGIAIPLVMESVSGMNGKEALIFSTELIGTMIFPIAVVFSIPIINDFSNGYIKDAVAYGYKRKDIFLAKAIAFFVGIVFIMLVFPTVFTAVCTILNGYGTEISLEEVTTIIRMVLLIAVVVIGISSIAYTSSFIARKSIYLFGIFILYNFIFAALTATTNEILHNIYDITVFGQVSFATAVNLTFSEGCQVVLVSLVTFILFMIIGIVTFKKQDIK